MRWYSAASWPGASKAVKRPLSSTNTGSRERGPLGTLGVAPDRAMPGARTPIGAASPIGVGGEAAAVAVVRTVTTAAPATARRSRRLGRAVDAMLASSSVHVGLPAVRTGGANGSVGEPTRLQTASGSYPARPLHSPGAVAGRVGSAPWHGSTR